MNIFFILRNAEQHGIETGSFSKLFALTEALIAEAFQAEDWAALDQWTQWNQKALDHMGSARHTKLLHQMNRGKIKRPGKKLNRATLTKGHHHADSY